MGRRINCCSKIEIEEKINFCKPFFFKVVSLFERIPVDMKECISPPLLVQNDKAVIISPSGSIDSLFIDGAKFVLESWGLNVVVSEYAREKNGRFCGTVEQRIGDLQNAMDDPDIKLILCSRGGYGIVHLLDRLNFTEIKKYPKWLVGYSDITALHLAFMENGILSIHAPMARHLTEDAQDTASLYLKKLLFEGIEEYSTPAHLLNRGGVAEGYLWGGNLAVLSGLIGTPFIDVPDNSILFIEDIGETAYKIDRMMWQLKLSGILERLSGLIVGKFTDCVEDPLMYTSIYSSIMNLVAEYNFPVVFDFPVGHVKDNYPLVYSGLIRLDVGIHNVLLKRQN